MAQQFHGIHLVGSMPFDTGDGLFDFLGETPAIAGRLSRVPDETGARAGWVSMQIPSVMGNPAMEPVPPAPDAPIQLPLAQIREGLTADDIDFGDGFDYGPASAASYDLFKQAKADGKVPGDARLLVAIPTAHNVIGFLVTERSQQEALVAYNRELKRSVDEILASVPHEELAIQWDLVAEMETLEPTPSTVAATVYSASDVHDEIALVSGWIPDDVELGFHLCYGDSNRDNLQPGIKSPFELEGLPAPDMAGVRKTLDAIFQAAGRKVDFVHCAVPIAFTEARHFEPLTGLDIPADTELFLGLVHPQDAGIEQSMRRAELVAKALGGHEFGIATECGMGRYGEETGKFASAIDKLSRLSDEYERAGTPD